jgi:hypothetical protein
MEEYEKERSKIKERLTQRGYNSNLIEKQLLKVVELDRKEIQKEAQENKWRVLQITHFRPHFPCSLDFGNGFFFNTFAVFWWTMILARLLSLLNEQRG